MWCCDDVTWCCDYVILSSISSAIFVCDVTMLIAVTKNEAGSLWQRTAATSSLCYSLAASSHVVEILLRLQ